MELSNIINEKNNFYKLIGNRIRDIRNIRNFTQEELSFFLECKINHIDQIEKGNKEKISASELFLLALYLGNTFDSFFENIIDINSSSQNNHLFV